MSFVMLAGGFWTSAPSSRSTRPEAASVTMYPLNALRECLSAAKTATPLVRKRTISRQSLIMGKRQGFALRRAKQLYLRKLIAPDRRMNGDLVHRLPQELSLIHI